MRNLKLGLAAVVAGAAFLMPGLAGAATISEDISFNLGGFVDITAGSNIPPPITSITGAITVTYDPTLTYDNDTADITVHSLTGITVGSPLGFTYQNGFLEFGGTQNDSDLVFSNTNDLVVSFNVTDPANPTFIPCSTAGYTCGQYTGSNLVEAAGYTQAAYATGWFYGAPQSTVAPTLPSTPPTLPSSTPEPSTVVLLGMGTAVLAFAVARRHRAGGNGLAASASLS